MGEAHRSPIFPYLEVPYHRDTEAYVNRYRFENDLSNELYTSYRLHWYCNFYHPNRECNDSPIYDAEYFKDIYKRIEEQRHDTAI